MLMDSVKQCINMVGCDVFMKDVELLYYPRKCIGKKEI